ncbi:hypothetical protein APSETT444_007064 [Aspergillus pseudonomiae]
MADLQGIMVALITPFTDDQSAIHEGRLQMLVERQIQAGVHGLVPGGTYGYEAVNMKKLRSLITEIDQVTHIPIVFYNIPSATGLKLSPTELASLSTVGVRYLKDTSGDGPALTELLFGLSDKITVFNGWDTVTFYGLAAGARGGIWGAANLIPELAVELWETVAIKGDLKKGREV